MNRAFGVTDNCVVTHAELMERIADLHAKLESLVDQLDDARLAAAGADGWAPKDHLIHVASWENMVRALLERSDRYAAMGIEKMSGATIEKINQAVWDKRHHDSPAQAKAYFKESHDQLVAALNRCSIEDLEKPYAHYVPEAAEKPSGQSSMLNWVEGSTYGHYPEHIEWLTALLAK